MDGTINMKVEMSSYVVFGIKCCSKGISLKQPQE
jgi:hypothetical protein